MPRQARVNIAGKHYVTNSGKTGLNIFKCENNKMQFFELLCKSCKRYNAKIQAYSITDSEYHLILSLDKSNLSLLMRQLSATYAIFFNGERNKKGSIWHDRYRSWAISEKDDYALVQKYIANIPVIQKISESPFEYKYSSFCTKNSNNFETPCFENEKRVKWEELLLKDTFSPEDQKALKAFKRIRPEIKNKDKKEKKAEPLEKIFKKYKSVEKRNKRIKKAFIAGYSQNEIAGFLGLSQSSISKIINRDA